MSWTIGSIAARVCSTLSSVSCTWVSVSSVFVMRVFVSVRIERVSNKKKPPMHSVEINISTLMRKRVLRSFLGVFCISIGLSYHSCFLIRKEMFCTIISL